jgi:hypothetical protein
MPSLSPDPPISMLVGDNHLVNVARALRSDGIDRPLASRLSAESADFERIMDAHRRAVEARRPLYRDPISGLSVFTAVFLADRGYCCGSGCRHCPYESCP